LPTAASFYGRFLPPPLSTGTAHNRRDRNRHDRNRHDRRDRNRYNRYFTHCRYYFNHSSYDNRRS
jgi:hypothetical protein